MADEHSVSGAAHSGPEPSEPTLAKTTASSAAPTGPPPSADLVPTAGAAPVRVPKPDVKNSVVLALAVVILAFTAISGVSIWAAASFEGGRPGITGPADGHREPPIIEPADRARLPSPEPEADPETTAEPGPTDSHPESPETEPTPPGPPIDGTAAAGAATSGPAAGEQRAGQPQTGRDGERGTTTDWAAVAYPHDCAGAPFDVKDARPLAADGRTYVVQVRCAAGSGTAPDGLYTYTLAADGAPTYAGTLLAPGEDRVVKELAVRDGKIHATLQGWSTDDIPRCCPDTEEVRVLTP